MHVKLTPEEAFAQKFYLQSLARTVLPEHRVNCCLRRVLPNKRSVEIWRSAAHNRAHYRNLMTCGCVWICNVCAAKISERRRAEISRVLSHQKSLGFEPMLATFTMRHGANDTLKQTIYDLVEAYKATTSGGGWQIIKDKHHISGWVRALEMTHGRNGWHPHLHVLLFADTNVSVLGDEIGGRWLNVLRTVKRTGEEGVAFDVRVSNDAIADYVAKFGHEPVNRENTISKYWTMEHEVSKSVSKRAHGDNRNPFEILFDTGIGSDLVSKQLFREYANETKGRRQLEWSRQPDIRRAASIVELSDEDIMQAHDQDAYMLAKLTVEQWHVVIRNAAVSTLLSIANKGDVVELHEFLEDIGAGAIWVDNPI